MTLINKIASALGLGCLLGRHFSAALGSRAEERVIKTHDYSREKRYWGHDYTIMEVINEGQILRAMGWGDGLENGDFMLLQNGAESTRYRIVDVKYFADPSDMWNAALDFAPRKEVHPVESKAVEK